MRFAVDLPTFAEYADLRLLARVAAEAEAAGWDAVHLWERGAVRPGRGLGRR